VITGASKLLTITATAFPPAAPPGTPEHTRVDLTTLSQWAEHAAKYNSGFGLGLGLFY